MLATAVSVPAYAQGSRDPSAEAAELNRRSKELYQGARYAEAAALLREAYRRKPEPVIQYNLARACEKMSDYACAVTAYETYLATHPVDRTSVEIQLERCRWLLANSLVAPPELAPPRVAEPSPPRQLAASLVALPDPVPPPPVVEPSRTPRNLAPPIVASVGVGVGLGVGLALEWAAHSRHDAAVRDPTQKGAAQDQASAESLARAGNITFLAGGAVAVTGLVWWILDVRSRGAVAPRLSIAARLHIGADSVAVRMTF